MTNRFEHWVSDRLFNTPGATARRGLFGQVRVRTANGNRMTMKYTCNHPEGSQNPENQATLFVGRNP